MSKILCIDTATDVCTVAIMEGEKIVALKESGNERSHAVQLAPFIEEVMSKASLTVNDLDAIAISRGPGSYTGLRIGVSTAKGMCYGSGKPLISVSTLQSMCSGVPHEFLDKQKLNDYYFAPMLDARRMEVYSALYHSDFTLKQDIKAIVVDEQSFVEYLDEKPVVFFGEGATKTKEIITHRNAIYFDGFKHTAQNMGLMATQKLREKKFEDVAYFEPFYLKEFQATTPKKNIFT